METRTIGTTGVDVSVVGIGAWQMGGPDTAGAIGHGWGDVDDQRSVRIVHRAQDLGINLIDTADIYGHGHSEEVVGQALEGRRDRWVVATKGGVVKDPSKRGCMFDGSSAHIREACEASLRRLKMDHVDFYQLHNVPQDDEVADTMAELAKLKQEGKIRFYGISIGDPRHIKKLREYGPVDIAQIGVNLLSRREMPALELCASENIGTFIRTPLAWGAAFGRYANAVPDFEYGDTRHERDREGIAKAHERGAQFSFLWEGGERSPAQAALRWVLDLPGVCSVIPGTKKLEHLEDNADAGSVPPLTDDEQQRCAALFDDMPALSITGE